MLETPDHFIFIQEKKEKKIHIKELFIKNLLLRSLSKPAKPYNSQIEIFRRIIQLLLLVYKRPLQSATIDVLIKKCYCMRFYIPEFKKQLKSKDINIEQYIVFCYWYLNQHSLKIYRVMVWIVKYGILDYSKSLAANPNIISQAYEFIRSNERGNRLLRLIIMQENDRDKVSQDDIIINKLKNF